MALVISFMAYRDVRVQRRTTRQIGPVPNEIRTVLLANREFFNRIKEGCSSEWWECNQEWRVLRRDCFDLIGRFEDCELTELIRQVSYAASDAQCELVSEENFSLAEKMVHPYGRSLRNHRERIAEGRRRIDRALMRLNQLELQSLQRMRRSPLPSFNAETGTWRYIR